MRLRYIKNAKEKMEMHDKVITNPEQYRYSWNDIFGNDNPIHVEFGAGRGGFIVKMAEKYHDINYLAFERNSKVIIKGLNKLPEKVPSNFYFVHSDIRKIEDIFNESFIERIYLNFSDPWPKERHSKRRLTHRRFLELYKKILVPKGEIHLKTDNDMLFDFSLDEFKEMGWEIVMVTRDLHNSKFVDGNIMTEYEEKFVKKGQHINKLIAISPKK
ncbi:tRNA (guanine-N7-)-methyltransferase [Caminicella sporogenes DSM 14501]|uniref:tRNA (guanine-N(7)-)-methyltransferase n=1 Tax=Caminicella sporogenes DSM 14501 TaxID=1121266 RepID=A0A1M6N584_9FIRM|nr:tRNA (guanosine(46)-N7)-methyltransferase TrmB [Caminicella sporogenes]RKD22357.1 tRNA (guanosine(46)-N7)-methyltransferase TrmB [Caminicella sporogenes]SHJ90860.1 tRNA (guanine-N7-)-methyltransferase [Caminicella sporogenes DSM 14501]